MAETAGPPLPVFGRSPLRRPSVIVWVAIGLFVLFFGSANWFRQVNLHTAQFDMGNMDQILWHSLHGNWFHFTDPAHPVNVARVAYHADYLLLSYLPFYALFPDPRTPLLLQVLAVASGAIPLFWLARKKIGGDAAALLSALYLLYPTLGWATIFDVHAVVLTMPIFLWAWWAATERQWWFYYPLILLAVLAKEEVGVIVAAMGLYWIWRPGYRIMGMITIVIGLGWSALMLGWAIPNARHVPGHFALEYYAYLGGNYSEVLKNIIFHPQLILDRLYSWDAFSMLKTLLLPVGLVAILGLPVLLVAAPAFLINLLSTNSAQHTIYFHYLTTIVPFVFLASTEGLAFARRCLRAWKPGWPHLPLERTAVIGITLLSLFAVSRWSPLPGGEHHYDVLKPFTPSPYRKDIRLVQETLRPTDRVVATSNIVPQFSRRDWIWGFPNDLDQADAVIVLEGGGFELVRQQEISRLVRELADNPQFRLVHQREQFWYFRKN